MLYGLVSSYYYIKKVKDEHFISALNDYVTSKALALTVGEPLW
jgi:hypothetical protein